MTQHRYPLTSPIPRTTSMPHLLVNRRQLYAFHIFSMHNMEDLFFLIQKSLRILLNLNTSKLWRIQPHELANPYVLKRWSNRHTTLSLRRYQLCQLMNRLTKFNIHHISLRISRKIGGNWLNCRKTIRNWTPRLGLNPISRIGPINNP